MSGFAGMNSLDSGLSSAGMPSRLDNPAKQPDSVHSGVHRIAGQDGHTGPAGRPGIGQSLGDGAAGVLMGGQRVDGLLGKDVEVADAHAHELDRLDVLMSQNLIDTPPAQDIDAYARIATRTFGTMYAMVSLVDGEREWFKSWVGGAKGVTEVIRTKSIGHHIVVQDTVSPLVVLDLQQDERFKACTLVTGQHRAGFYAGAPLIVTKGEKQYCIGVLCVMDEKPREIFDEKDIGLLKMLALSCVREIETIPVRVEGAMAPLTEEGGTIQRVQELKVFIPFSRRKVDDGCIKVIAEKLKPRIVHTGQYITRVGDSGDTLFFLASGSCSCVLNGVELERLRKGQCFGEVALLNMCKIRAMGVPMEEARNRCRRNANVVALERCELLEFCFEEAWPLLKKAPNLWYTLEDMAKRRAQCVNKIGGGKSSG